MNRLARQCVLAVFFAVFIASAIRAGDDFARLVTELASSDFATRQQATAALAEAGSDAFGPLESAAGSSDAEVRRRALGVLFAHSVSGRSDWRVLAQDALQRIAGSSSVPVAAAARDTLDRVREVVAGNAVAELTRMGATVMPVQTGEPLVFNVQIRQSWSGGDIGLSLLEHLHEVPWLSLENSPISDAGLIHIAKLGRASYGLSKLYLGNSQITGSGLPRLASLQSLQYLSLKQLPIDDERLARLPDFPLLQYLGLDGTRVGDEGLKTLARYPHLQVLWLDNTPITDAGLAHLLPLTKLRTLYLPSTNTAGPGLAELRALPSLTSLSLKGVKLSRDSLKHVAQLEQLESLGLDMTNVNDDQLADLSGLSRIRVLWLSGTPIGDPGIHNLKSLHSLQMLHLTDTQVTPDGAAEIQRALPGCQLMLGRFQQSDLQIRPRP
jgi:hypothetical protein